MDKVTSHSGHKAKHTTQEAFHVVLDWWVALIVGALVLIFIASIPMVIWTNVGDGIRGITVVLALFLVGYNFIFY